jgi:phage shock protein E
METRYAIVIGLLFAFYAYKVITARMMYAKLTKLIASDTPYTLIDVRTSGEYAAGHIPGAKNIDHEKIGGSLGKMAKDREIVLYCQSGSRASAALGTLKSKGYTNAWSFGGISRWRGKIER